MDFKTAMEHYRAGTASGEERRLVEEELEKSRLIAEYLDSQWETEAVEELPQADMKKVRRNLRKRNALIVLTSLILAAAMLLGTVHLAIPALESRYASPETYTYNEYHSDMNLALIAYADLFSPSQKIYNLKSVKTGFAAYNLTVSQWHADDHGDQSYLTAYLEKGELTFPEGFWDYVPSNILERATYPFSYMDGEFDRRTRESLEQLPGYVQVTAAVSFPEDLSMEELIAFRTSLEEGYMDWIGIRTSPLDTQMYPLAGMKPFSGGLVVDCLNDEYPYFDIHGSKATPEILEAHFKALLTFSQDQYHAGTGIEVINFQGDSFYQQALDYIEENGVYAYGCFVSGPPQLFLDLLDSGAASQVWIQSARIST